MAAPLYLVDASIYFFRAWHSIPDTFHASNGRPVGGVYGFTNFLLDLLASMPELISVAFDESLVSCYRNRIYPAYKANRDLPDDNIKFQLAQCQRVTRALGLHNLCLEDYEADDIIGTLLRRFGGPEGHPGIIVTRDKDLGQLLGDDDRLWDYSANEYAGPREIEMKFGVSPAQLPDYLALAGDAIDNIPGVKGVGAKTAARLLRHFGTLDNLLDNLDAVETVDIRGAKRLAAILEAHRDELEIYRQVTGICCEVPMTVAEADLRPGVPDKEELERFCDEMAFGLRTRQRMALTS